MVYADSFPVRAFNNNQVLFESSNNNIERVAL